MNANSTAVDMIEIMTEATRIATINLPTTAAEVFEMRHAYNMLDRDLSRFVSLMIDDARDESSDYFSSLPIDEYSRRYSALHALLVSMMTPIIFASVAV